MFTLETIWLTWQLSHLLVLLFYNGSNQGKYNRLNREINLADYNVNAHWLFTLWVEAYTCPKYEVDSSIARWSALPWYTYMFRCCIFIIFMIFLLLLFQYASQCRITCLTGTCRTSPTDARTTTWTTRKSTTPWSAWYPSTTGSAPPWSAYSSTLTGIARWSWCGTTPRTPACTDR